MVESRSVVAWGWGGRGCEWAVGGTTMWHQETPFPMKKKFIILIMVTVLQAYARQNLSKSILQNICNLLYINYTSIVKKCFTKKNITIPPAPLYLFFPLLLPLSQWNILNSVIYTYGLQFLCIFSNPSLRHLWIHPQKSPRFSILDFQNVEALWSTCDWTLFLGIVFWHPWHDTVLILILITFTPAPSPTPFLL